MSTTALEESTLFFKDEIDIVETKIDLEDEQMESRSQEETHDIVDKHQVIKLIDVLALTLILFMIINDFHKRKSWNLLLLH